MNTEQVKKASKFQAAKDELGYSKEGRICKNCKQFKCDEVEAYEGHVYKEFKNNCTKGNFVVQRSASCDFHERKKSCALTS